MAAPGSPRRIPSSPSSRPATAMACTAASQEARRCWWAVSVHRSRAGCRWTCWRWMYRGCARCTSARRRFCGDPDYRWTRWRATPGRSRTSCSAASASACRSSRTDGICCAASGASVHEETHLDAGELDHVVVAQAGRLGSDRRTVEQREVVDLAAVDVHDVVGLGAARDRGHLHPGTAERGEGLAELDLAACERARQHLQFRLLQRRGAVRERACSRGRRERAAGLLGGRGGGAHLLHRPGGGLDHHGLLELVLLLVVLDEAQLMVTDGDDVAVLQGMLLDQLAVDVGAVGAVQILEERVIEDVDDQRVVTADGSVVNADVIVREPADGVALLVHVVFRHHLAIQAQHQPCHVLVPLSRTSRTNPGSCRISSCEPGTHPRCVPSPPRRCPGLHCRWPAGSVAWRPYPD